MCSHAQQLARLLEAVTSGVGVGGIHGGAGDAFRQACGFQWMMGGQFVSHPGDSKAHYTVRIIDRDHPITEGIEDFELTSEQYYMHVDPHVKVLATTTFTGEHAPWIEGATVPVAWKKMYGKSRVFYTSLGHVVSDFNVPEAKTIVQRGMLWATR